jgi:2-aminoethylphosphonate-pyruvate transaminase
MAVLIAAANALATGLFMRAWPGGRRPPHAGLEDPLTETKTMDRDRILLTPGPLTTTLRTKLAMLHDWGSWDTDFNAVTAGCAPPAGHRPRHGDSHVLVPLQGSGTFSVEAAVATVVPRMAMCWCWTTAPTASARPSSPQLMGRRVTVVPQAEDAPVSPAVLEQHLLADPSITHVVLIHCETGTGVREPAGRDRGAVPATAARA